MVESTTQGSDCNGRELLVTLVQVRDAHPRLSALAANLRAVKLARHARPGAAPAKYLDGWEWRMGSYPQR